jgi:molybdopterin molybdotransferase
VVPLEDTRQVGDGEVRVLRSIEAGFHVRRSGEDTRKGSLLAARGTTIDVGLSSLLAGAGLARVEVVRRPGFYVCATGSELAQPGTPLGDGQIYESNALLLSSVAALAPVEVVGATTVDDEPGRTRERLAHAMETADVVCISGGVSVGRHDLVKDVLGELGVEEVFWKVRVKPGKPLFFGTHRRRGAGGARRGWVFAVPGNPVSCLTSYVMFVEPFLWALSGSSDPRPITARAVLAESVRSRTDRRLFVTARLRAEGAMLVAEPVARQGSGMLHSMVGANGYVVIPEDTDFVDKGEQVQVALLPGFRVAGLRVGDGHGR